MWQDPIIKETRELREDYASKFKNDPDAIFEDILKRQRQNMLFFYHVNLKQKKKLLNNSEHQRFVKHINSFA